MAARQLLFREDARNRIRRGVDTLTDAVRITLGPWGRAVILERDYDDPQIVNSGVIIAKSIELEDRFENRGAQLLREAASRTSDMAGDGTSTATVLADAIEIAHVANNTGHQHRARHVEGRRGQGARLRRRSHRCGAKKAVQMPTCPACDALLNS